MEFFDSGDGEADVQVGPLDEGKTIRDFADMMGPEPSQLPSCQPERVVARG